MRLLPFLLAGATLSAAAAAQCPPPGRGIAPPSPPPQPRAFRGPGDVVPADTPSAPAPRPGPAATPGPVRAAPTPRYTTGIPQTVARVLARYGAPAALTHERTARGILVIDWDYPRVWKDRGDEPTSAQPVSAALPIGDAMALVAAGDDRPLLLLRECRQCGTGAEQWLARKLGDEKTILLSKWFHCVHVDDGVRHPDHPLHAVFATPRAPHLVLCRPDGSGAVGFGGDVMRSALWHAMTGALAEAYEGDPEAVVDEMVQLLSRYDHLDSMEREASSRLLRELAREGGDSRRAADLRGELATIAAERDAVAARQREITDLRRKERSAAGG